MKIPKITQIKEFAHGHRGVIYTGKYKNKKVAIKAKHPKSEASGRMEIEARTLERLQNYKIGPKLLFYTSDYFVYEFIDGIFIKDYIEKNKKPKIQKVLIHVFNQCFQLDNLGINKEEMHHPYKHVLITKKDKVFLIDFERSVVTQKPHNVTQFCQCIMQMKPELEKKGFDINKRAIIKAAKEYKDNISLKKFKRILELID